MNADFLLDAIGEIDERFIREAEKPMIHTRRRFLPAAAAAVLLLGFTTFAVTRLHSPVRDTPLAPATEAVAEQPAGAYGEHILRYHALTLTGDAAAYVSPETVQLGIFRDAVFSEEEIDTVVQRLQDAGWEDMTSTIYDGTVVFFRQPETDPPSLEEILEAKQNDTTAPGEADVERAKDFLLDSGLDSLIYDKTGVSLTAEADPTRADVVFRGYYNGIDTGTYIRMSFYDNGDLAEGKLYAVIPETETVSALPLETALKTAYSVILNGGGENYDKTAVTAVRLEYIDGLPYYILTLDKMWGEKPLEARALAVDTSLLEEDVDLQTAFDRQFILP